MGGEMKFFSFAAALATLAPWTFAQNPAAAPPPAEGRVSNRNIVLLTKDPEAQHHLWVDIMGATIGQTSPNRTFYILPKVVVIVDKGNPTAGTEGSIINHVGFRVHDIKDILAKVEAQHFTIQVVNPSKDSPNPTQAFFLGPDDLRIELLPGPNLTTVSENHQVHFFTPDIDAMSKWYVDKFGATPQALGKVKMANLPGVALIFSPTDTAVTGTKGRALDHISFEVKDLESFIKDLEASGVKLDTPYRKIPQTGMGVAFLTDPWGTRVELTEHPAPAASARQ
jgi:catechol 2,3-dioxygenase-like lactoylglutathione lyase family enzyme